MAFNSSGHLAAQDIRSFEKMALHLWKGQWHLKSGKCIEKR
jgi:hypothetical protein